VQPPRREHGPAFPGIWHGLTGVSTKADGPGGRGKGSSRLRLRAVCFRGDACADVQGWSRGGKGCLRPGRGARNGGL